MQSEGTTPGQARRGLSASRELGLVSAIYLLLTAVLTYPTVLRLGSHIPGYGDAPYAVWDLWAFSRAITAPHGHWWATTDLLFHPLPDAPIIWASPANALLSLPLVVTLGPAVAYNVLFLGSFVLSGLFCYLLVRHLTRDRLASLAAGVIFSFSAYHYAHGREGHLHLFCMQWLPLCLLSLLRLWERPSLPRALHLAVAMTLIVANSPYYSLYFLAPMLACFFVYELWKDRARLLERRFLTGLFLALAVSAASAFVVYGRLFFPDEGTAEALLSAAMDTEMYSADLLAYLVPSPTHPLFGALVAPIYANFTAGVNTVEMTVYVGFVALLLAAWGVRARGKRAVAFWVLLALVGFVLSLGPVLHVNGVSVITMPYALLTRLPVFWTVRVPSRACVALLLSVSVLASYGLSNLLERMRGRERGKIVVGAAIVLAISCESLYALPFPTSSTALPTFYRQLETDHERGARFELPTGRGNDWSTAWHMLYQTSHGEELATGYAARVPESVLEFPRLVLRGNLLSPPVRLLESNDRPAFEAAFGDLLAYNDIRYVIVQQRPGPHATPYSDEQYREVRASLSRSLGNPLYEDDGLTAYEVSPVTAEALASFSGGVELVGHKVVEAAVCPDGGSSCTYLVTFWRARVALPERYRFYVHVIQRGSDRVHAGRYHRLGYQYSLGNRKFYYDTSWWSPGVVIADYTLLPSANRDGVRLAGTADISVWLADLESGVALDAQSDVYATDGRGRLLIGSYRP